MAAPGTTQLDGRTARAARTRDAVVEAFLELLDEGQLRPPARLVAERAGVSLRSVYVRFADLDSLAVAAAERQWERLAPLVERIDPSLSLADRLTLLVEQRCRLLETAAPVRRAAELQEPFSTSLAHLLRTARALARSEVEAVFGPELDRRTGAARERLLDALDVACSATTWETLRRHRDLSPQRARRVVTDLLTALLDERRT